MDYDGTEQRQLTPNNSLSLTPAVSPSGDMFAFTSYSVDSRGLVTSTPRLRSSLRGPAGASRS